MKIDRHNYEEFFVLYWDNELTTVQKQAVEDFVKQNADLREEFEIFGETRFTPNAELKFKEKDFLLNNSFINITNYEEQLLNYIDDEVNGDERKEVEKFVASNPVAQKELELLQRTKLQPEAEVSFPDKSVLYRREEKVRIISMTWFRVAVASVIILIAGFTALQLVNNGRNINGPSNGSSSLANNGTQKNSSGSEQAKTLKDKTTPQATNDQAKNFAKNDNKLTIQSKKEDKTKVDEPLLANNLTQKPENKNNLPTPRNTIISTDKNTGEVYTVVDLEKVDKAQRQSSAINISLSNEDVTNKPELALYIPEAKEKEKDGGGLKEFLRKTTRVFERRTKIQTTTEDNKLLVGAFAVSLK